MAIKFLNTVQVDTDVLYVDTANDRVGIGTASPDAKLHVLNTNVGVKSIYATAIIENTDAQLDLTSSSAGTWGSSLNFIEGNGATNTNVWSIARTTSGGGNNLRFNFGTANQHDNDTKMTISSAGNVGIGTTSPVNYSGYTSLQIDGSNGAVLRMDRDDNAVQFEQATVSDLVYLKTITASDMWFGTNNAERMRITNTGQVGIGTDSPNQKLEVSAATDTTISIASSDTSLNASQNIGILEFASNNETSLSQAYTTFSKIKGISQTAVSGTGSVNGAITFETASANVLGERMRITSSGNVGIGNTGPVNGKLVVTSGVDGPLNTIRIQHTRDDADVGTKALEVDMDLSGADTTTADRTNRGIFVDLDSSADGDASNEHRIHGIESDVRFTGFSDVVRAGQFYAESNNITEKTAQLVGVYGQAAHDSGSVNGGVSNMYGVYGYSQPQDLGDVDNAFGGYFLVNIGTSRGNADIGVTKGVEGEISIDKANTISYGEMMAVSGIIDNNEGTVPTFGNQYLFKGDYQGTKGDNAWGIYTEGDKHYFEGKVGIGTTTPDYLLDVEGSANNADIAIRVNNTFDDNLATSNPNAVVFLNAASNNGYLRVHGAPANTAAKHQIDLGSTAGSSFLTFSPGGAERMRIATDGYVGIGISNPIAPLHITGPAPIATQPVIKVERTSPVVDYQDTNTISGYLFFTERFSNLAGSIISTRKVQKNPGGEGVYTNFNHGLLTGQGTEHIQKNNSFHWKIDNSTNEVLTINTSGKVGIGTTNPLYKLHVQDRIHIEDTATLQPKISFSENTNSSGEFVLEYNGVGVGAGNYVSFYSEVTGWITKGNGLNYIPSNGRVGIGTTNPSTELDVNGVVTATGGNSTEWNSAYDYTNGQNNSIQGKWYSGDPHNYVSGVSYYTYTKVANLAGNTTNASFEYYVKRDFNYPGVVKGSFTVSTYNGSSMSVQHDLSTGKGEMSPQVYIDNSRNIWIRFAGAAWTTVMRWRCIFNSGVTIYDGTTSQNTQPTNSALAIPGDSLKFGWNDVSNITVNNNTFEVYAAKVTDDLIVSGNVGIGTTSPSRLLDVDGIQGWSEGTNVEKAYLNPTGTGTDFYLFGDNGNIRFDSRAGSNSYINTGNVGIGTDSPSNKLEVVGSNALRIHDGTDQGSIFFRGDRNDVYIKESSYQLLFGAPSGMLFELDTNNNDGDVFNVMHRGSSRFYINGVDGNVGIDVTNPTAKLHVHTSADNAYAVRIEGSTNNAAGVWTGLGIGGEANNTKSAILFEDIGVSYTRGKLHLCVNNTANQTNATTADAKLTVSNDGNVGIGTTSPQAKLHVSGGSSIETTLIVGAEGTGNDKSARVFLNEGEGGVSNSKDYGFSLAYDGQGSQYAGLSANQFGILRHQNSAGGAAVMIMNRVNNNTTFTGSVTATSYINSSDERLKENIKELSGNVEVNWKTFELKAEKGQKRYGVIAQELEKTNPEFVKEDSKGFKSVNYIDLLIAKIAELEQRIQLIENK